MTSGLLCLQVGQHSQFALIQFASRVDIQFSLRTNTELAKLTDTIEAMEFLEHDDRLTTRTDLALLKSLHIFQNMVMLKLLFLCDKTSAEPLLNRVASFCCVFNQSAMQLSSKNIPTSSSEKINLRIVFQRVSLQPAYGFLHFVDTQIILL